MTIKKPDSLIGLEKNIPPGHDLVLIPISAGQAYHGEPYFQSLIEDWVIPYCEKETAAHPERPTKFLVVVFDEMQGETLEALGLVSPDQKSEKGKELGNVFTGSNMEFFIRPEIHEKMHGVIHCRDIIGEQGEAGKNYGQTYKRHKKLWNDLYENNPTFKKMLDESTEYFYQRNVDKITIEKGAALKLSREFFLSEFAIVTALSDVHDKPYVELYPGGNNPILGAIAKGEVPDVPEVLKKTLSCRQFVRAKAYTVDENGKRQLIVSGYDMHPPRKAFYMLNIPTEVPPDMKDILVGPVRPTEVPAAEVLPALTPGAKKA